MDVVVARTRARPQARGQRAPGHAAGDLSAACREAPAVGRRAHLQFARRDSSSRALGSWMGSRERCTEAMFANPHCPRRYDYTGPLLIDAPAVSAPSARGKREALVWRRRLASGVLVSSGVPSPGCNGFPLHHLTVCAHDDNLAPTRRGEQRARRIYGIFLCVVGRDHLARVRLDRPKRAHATHPCALNRHVEVPSRMPPRYARSRRNPRRSSSVHEVDGSASLLRGHTA